jgi:hypothetical protein
VEPLGQHGELLEVRSNHAEHVLGDLLRYAVMARSAAVTVASTSSAASPARNGIASCTRMRKASAPATLEFLRAYPAAQLDTIARFTADLAAAPTPA